jgi:hypothetical protein
MKEAMPAQPAQRTVKEHHYVPQVKQCGEGVQERSADPGCKDRRWVVRAVHPSFNRFGKLLARNERLSENYEALPHLAAAIITSWKCGVIYA